MGNVDVNVAAVDAAVHEATVREKSQPQGVYLSRGKTDEEIDRALAEREAHDAEVFTVEMTRKQIREAGKPAIEAQCLFLNAAAIMNFLSETMADGNYEAEWLSATMEMCGRGFRSAADEEGEALYQISHLLMNHKAVQKDDD